MNVLHWHLTDDQSFPIEIKKFPELHKKGAGWLGYIHNKGPTENEQQPGRYYTQNDVKELVEYARIRGVRIIPEIDMPAHTRSWGMGYEEISSHCPRYIQERASHLKARDFLKTWHVLTILGSICSEHPSRYFCTKNL